MSLWVGKEIQEMLFGANVNDLYFQGELDDLLDLDSGLTDWEVEFIESVGQWRIDHPFTPRQIAKIHQIWDRRCG